VQRWLQQFSAEEGQCLVSVLTKLADALEEEIGPNPS
jgi:hypothetical protein